MCDWQVPLDARVLRFSAVVDRGLEIQEGDETNNEMERLMAINELEENDGDESAGLLTSQTAWIGIVALALGANLAICLPLALLLPPPLLPPSRHTLCDFYIGVDVGGQACPWTGERGRSGAAVEAVVLVSIREVTPLPAPHA